MRTGIFYYRFPLSYCNLEIRDVVKYRRLHLIQLVERIGIGAYGNRFGSAQSREADPDALECIVRHFFIAARNGYFPHLAFKECVCRCSDSFQISSF